MTFLYKGTHKYSRHIHILFLRVYINAVLSAPSNVISCMLSRSATLGMRSKPTWETEVYVGRDCLHWHCRTRKYVRLKQVLTHKSKNLRSRHPHSKRQWEFQMWYSKLNNKSTSVIETTDEIIHPIYFVVTTMSERSDHFSYFPMNSLFLFTFETLKPAASELLLTDEPSLTIQKRNVNCFI
jgi:hypothetical protein